MVNTAVILAAGLGSRLKDRTKEIPKGFIEIENRSLIGMSINKLFKSGIEKVYIGTGHLNEIYDEFARRHETITCIKNKIYSSTGSMFTLYNMREHINSDFLLLESDLLYSKRALETLQKSEKTEVILGSGKTDSGDEVYIETDEKNMLVNLSKDKGSLGNIHAELVGISRVSSRAFDLMCRYFESKKDSDIKMDYEYAMVGVTADAGFYVHRIDDLVWCEIDDENHLNRAINTIYPMIKDEKI